MNKQRKEKIKLIRKKINENKNELQCLLDEEQDYFDNMPENLQGSMRGSESEDAIDIMENCVEKIENIIEDLMDI